MDECLSSNGLKGRQIIQRKLDVIDANPWLATFCDVAQLLDINSSGEESALLVNAI